MIINYETNGGSPVPSERVIKNRLATEPLFPEKDGCTFEGWYEDEELTEKYDFTTPVTKSITLYAKWNEFGACIVDIDDTDINSGNGGSGHNCPSLKFDDLDISLWYHFDTDYVLENGIFKGTYEKLFSPDDDMTRAMMVTVLYRMEKEPAVNRSVPFADVEMDEYYANAVTWAEQNGITEGYSETEFAPYDSITREQIAAIMFRYAKFKGYDISVGENTNILSYEDYDQISEYAIPAMQYAVGSGMIVGRTEATLNPLESASRVEIAAMLHRFTESNK